MAGDDHVARLEYVVNARVTTQYTLLLLCICCSPIEQDMSMFTIPAMIIQTVWMTHDKHSTEPILHHTTLLVNISC
jgi:hypothetical protein